jgi:hypothetical protein
LSTINAAGGIDVPSADAGADPDAPLFDAPLLPFEPVAVALLCVAPVLPVPEVVPVVPEAALVEPDVALVVTPALVPLPSPPPPPHALST